MKTEEVNQEPGPIEYLHRDLTVKVSHHPMPNDAGGEISIRSNLENCELMEAVAETFSKAVKQFMAGFGDKIALFAERKELPMLMVDIKYEELRDDDFSTSLDFSLSTCEMIQAQAHQAKLDEMVNTLTEKFRNIAQRLELK